MRVIVAGYDGTENAAKAVAEAAVLARATGADLHLVQVVDDDALRQGMVTSDALVARETEAAAANADLLSRAGLSSQLADVTVRSEILRGPAALCLTDYAKSIDSDLIVLGNRRVKGIARVLGSVTIDVLRHAPCSVYVAETTA